MSNKQVAAIVGALLALTAAVIWTALPESCSHWRHRLAEAEFHTIRYVAGQDLSAEEAAVSAIRMQRPDGCY